MVTKYGEGEGATKREGVGASEVLPLQRGGEGGGVNHAEGWHKKFQGSFSLTF